MVQYLILIKNSNFGTEDYGIGLYNGLTSLAKKTSTMRGATITDMTVRSSVNESSEIRWINDQGCEKKGGEVCTLICQV